MNKNINSSEADVDKVRVRTRVVKEFINNDKQSISTIEGAEKAAQVRRRRPPALLNQQRDAKNRTKPEKA